jgi:hypothetical protein
VCVRTSVRACVSASHTQPCFSSTYVKGKAIPLQALTGPEDSRRVRLPDFKISAHEGGKVVSPTHRPPLPPGTISGTHFCWRLSRPQDHSAAGKIMSIKNSNDAIGNRSRDLPVCSSVPQPLRHRVPPFNVRSSVKNVSVVSCRERGYCKILVY